MGGMIAQELALARPELIRTLTIGASYCGGPEGTLMAPRTCRCSPPPTPPASAEQVFRAMWEINLSPGFREDDSRFAAFAEMGSALPAPQPVVLQQMRACGDHNTHERLGQISLPTLVIHGDADRLIGYNNGREIASPDPRRAPRDARGHRPHVLVGAARALRRADPRARPGAGLS